MKSLNIFGIWKEEPWKADRDIRRVGARNLAWGISPRQDRGIMMPDKNKSNKKLPTIITAKCRACGAIFEKTKDASDGWDVTGILYDPTTFHVCQTKSSRKKYGTVGVADIIKVEIPSR